ncbi:MAG: hypothetical protein ACOXZ4_02145 [Sphaerochaetaceae bacterium]
MSRHRESPKFHLLAKGVLRRSIEPEFSLLKQFLDQISAFIGQDVKAEHMAELSGRLAVEEYRLKITQEVTKTQEQSYTVYVLAIADKVLLEAKRSESSLYLAQKQDQIQQLFNQGSRYYRENKDLSAISAYISIAHIATSLPANRGEQWFKDAISRAKSILQPLEFTLSEGNPEVPSTVVTLRRKGRTFSARVGEAAVIAHSTVRDGLGNTYRDSQLFVTDGNGQFTFKSSNPTLVGQGSVEFSLSFASELALLEHIDSELAQEFSLLIDAKKVFYPYVRKAVSATQPLVIAVGEFSLEGEQLPSSYSLQALSSVLQKEGIKTLNSSTLLSEEESFNALVSRQYPQSRYAVTGSVGISLEKRLEQGFVVSVLGELSLVDLRTGVLLGSTQSFAATALAQTKEEAQREAFVRFGTIGAPLLYRLLYP